MGFLSKGQVPVLHFIEEPWDSHVLNQNILKQNLQTPVLTVEKKRIFLLNQHRDLLLGKGSGFLSCSEAKALVRLTYLYLCNLV